MRKTVYVCSCDVCKKVIEDDSKRFVIKLGVGNWSDHNSFDQKLEKDLCIDCYTALFDMAENTQTSLEERELTATVIKQRTAERNEEIWQLYEKGMGYKDIAEKFRISASACSNILTKWRKEHNIPLARNPK